MLRSAGVLAGIIVVVFAVAGLGAFFTRPSIPTWYETLRKPAFTPPNWVFGPAWTLLYLSMAVAAWVVWRQGGFGAHKAAFALFTVQLALNAAWTPVFFGMHRIGAAFVVICLLWAAIFATIVAFWRAVPAAGTILIPYQLWVTFAGLLNITLWRLNR